MHTCRRDMLPSDATPAHNTPHTHTRALWHTLTKYPWQDHPGEDDEARAQHQHAHHQQFQHHGAERLQHLLNTTLRYVHMFVTCMSACPARSRTHAHAAHERTHESRGHKGRTLACMLLAMAERTVLHTTAARRDTVFGRDYQITDHHIEIAHVSH